MASVLKPERDRAARHSVERLVRPSRLYPIIFRRVVA